MRQGPRRAAAILLCLCLLAGVVIPSHGLALPEAEETVREDMVQTPDTAVQPEAPVDQPEDTAADGTGEAADPGPEGRTEPDITSAGTQEDQGEQYAASNGELTKVTVSAGYLHKELTPQNFDTDMTLSAEEEGFAVTVTPYETKYAPTVTLSVGGGEEETLTQDTPSAFIPVAPGQHRTIILTSTPYKEGATVRTYTIRVYRTPTAMTWRAKDLVTLEDGTRLLPVSLFIPGGTRLRTLMFALCYDVDKLTPAEAPSKTNPGTDTTSIWSCMEYVPGLFYGNSAKDSPFDVVDSTLSKGVAATQLGIHTSHSGDMEASYTPPSEGVEALTLYFRVAEGAALSADTLTICRQSGVIPATGMEFLEYAPRTRTEAEEALYATVKNPGLVTLDMSPYLYPVAMPGKAADNGRLTISPERETYFSGETITFRAIPDSGYAFSHWTIDEGQAAQLGGADLSQSVLTVTVSGAGSLSSLKPLFIPTSADLPSGGSLSLTPPYTGKYLLAVNGSYAHSADTGAAAARSVLSLQAGPEVPDASQASVDDNGDTRLEFRETLDETYSDELPVRFTTQGTAEAENYQVGDTRTLRSYNPLGKQTAAGSTKWIDRTFRLAAQGGHINIWFDAADPMKVSPQQFDEMLESFEASYVYITDNFGGIYDRNANGRLDVLIYDIPDNYDTTGQYYGGLTMAGELYSQINGRGPVGNTMDAVHLDTYPTLGHDYDAPTLSTILPVMAHETQHLAAASALKEAVLVGGINNKVLGASMPPDWVDEGLSMAVEHALFGLRTERVVRYNESFNILTGKASLSKWEGSLDNYALSYLFMEYVLAQAGGDAFAGEFYRVYADAAGNDNAQAVLEEVLQTIPAFRDMSFAQVVESWYAAMMLQEDTGLYSFQDRRDLFRSVRPQSVTMLPSPLAPGAGAYLRLEDGASYTPAGGSDAVRYLGLTPADIILRVPAAMGGTVRVVPDKAAYDRGETVTLTAVPEAGCQFVSWTGDTTSTDATVVLKLNESMEVKPVFEVKQSGGGSEEGGGDPVVSVKPLDALAVGDAVPVLSEDGTQATVTTEEGAIVLQTVDRSRVDAVSDNPKVKIVAEPAEGKAFQGWLLATPAQAAEFRASISVSPGGIDPGSLLTDNPITLTLDGRSIVPVFRDAAEAAAGPVLQNIKVRQPEERFLVSYGDGGAINQNFTSTILEHHIYLLDGESQVQLTLYTLEDVTSVQVQGSGTPVKLTQLTPIEGSHMYRWSEDGLSETVTLSADSVDADGNGKVSILLTDAGGNESTYTVCLHVVAKPAVHIRQNPGGSVYVEAVIQNTRLGTATLDLVLKGIAAGGLTEPVIPAGLQCSKWKTEALGENSVRIRLTVEPEELEAMTNPADEWVIPLFEGLVSQVALPGPDHGINMNSIADQRMGPIYNTRILRTDGVRVTGSVTAYNAEYLPVVTLTGTNEPLNATVEAVDSDGYGLKTFRFTFETVPEGDYTLTVTKTAHTDLELTGLTIGQEDLDLGNLGSLRCGDLDGDGVIRAIDRDILTDPTWYGLAVMDNEGLKDYDLDGDGYLRPQDLNILLSPEHFGLGKQSIPWNKGGEGA